MDGTEKIFVGVFIVMVLAVGFNVYEINSLKRPQSAAGQAKQSIAGNAVAALSGPDVIPRGVPQIYGAELGVQYDVSGSTPEKADAAIRKLGVLDQQLTLSGADLQRYIGIVRQISCYIVT